MPNLRYQYTCKDQVCLHIDTQTQTAPPRKTATLATTIKASFTAQGVMGTVPQLGRGAEASASGGARSALAPTQPRGEDAFILPTRPTLFPESSHPIFSLLSPAIRPHPLPTTRAPEDLGPLWLVGGRDGLALCVGLGGSTNGLSSPLLWTGGFWRAVVVRIWPLGPGSSQRGHS